MVKPKGSKGQKGPKISNSARAGLQMPVGRMSKRLKNGGYSSRVSGSAGVAMAAALEYIVAEILELAGNAARESKKARIIPRHLMLVIRNDAELDRVFKDVVFKSAGVVPNIQSAILPKRKKSAEDSEKPTKSPKKKKSADDAEKPKKKKQKTDSAKKSTEKA